MICKNCSENFELKIHNQIFYTPDCRKIFQNRRKHKPLNQRCGNPACNKKATYGDGGYCSACSERLRTNGFLEYKEVYSKKRRIDSGTGYVIYYDPTSIHCNRNGQVSEHRAIMGDLLKALDRQSDTE